jgi:hypothetical protein
MYGGMKHNNNLALAVTELLHKCFTKNKIY